MQSLILFQSYQVSCFRSFSFQKKMSESEPNNANDLFDKDYCRYCHEEMQPCKECFEAIEKAKKIHRLCEKAYNIVKVPCQVCNSQVYQAQMLTKKEWIDDLFNKIVCCREECLWHIHQSQHKLTRQEIYNQYHKRDLFSLNHSSYD